ncbi:MAG: leucine dehydrogenase [Crocinitomicaceae bacterium]|nr:leucine dehydrogenase [Crocinitomicaceae bacterium]MDP4760229.1 leucine dehydrogenase [Crocinitomicaceae bacterium]
MSDLTVTSLTDLNSNPVIHQMSLMGHEQILFCNDHATGLKAIIAVHNTVLGPALGGTRMWMYDNEMEALNDVLRLSRGMTYKNAISGLKLGGGKAVIIGDSKTQKSEALFRRFGQFVNGLAGKYITAEDVGISPSDMQWVSEETNYVVGLPGKSGDPSPVTAFGVYMGMKAAAKMQYGSDDLSGKTIAVQGVGHVGEYLVSHLASENAKVFVTDINQEALKRVSEKYGATIVSPDEIYDVKMDIYAPCALGATVNDETLARLSCSVIAGAANNQLKDEKIHGLEVMKRGIIYAPDFAINAGGVINCFSEVEGLTLEWAHQKAEEIYGTIYNIVKRSQDEGVPTYQIANKMAEERVQSKGSLNL